MGNDNLVHLGIVFPKETIKRLDERKGKYYSRNKYLLKIVEEYLNENERAESKINSLQGAEVSTQERQAEKITPNPQTSTAASLMHVANDEGGNSDADVEKYTPRFIHSVIAF